MNIEIVVFKMFYHTQVQKIWHIFTNEKCFPTLILLREIGFWVDFDLKILKTENNQVSYSSHSIFLFMIYNSLSWSLLSFDYPTYSQTSRVSCLFYVIWWCKSFKIIIMYNLRTIDKHHSFINQTSKSILRCTFCSYFCKILITTLF